MTKLSPLSHPDMLEDPSVTERNLATRPNHAHRGRNLERKRSPLRDIPYLTGNVIDRKQQLKKLRGSRNVSGSKHHMVRAKKRRESDRRRIRTTDRGVKHLYTFWRNYRSPTDVSFEEWFKLRYAGFGVGKAEWVAIRRYDASQPYFLSNLYLARMRGCTELEVLADAETLIGKRENVSVYTAPPGRMDKRRVKPKEREARKAEGRSDGTISKGYVSIRTLYL